MVDALDEDDVLGIVDLVDDAIGAPSRAEAAIELEAERLPDAPRILQKNTGDELDDRGGSRLGKPVEGSVRG
jgi:hypothetical protein